MSPRNIYSVIFVGLIYLTIIKGSCLEYGHSCWGAHGKRSGGSDKIYHGGSSQLRNVDRNILTDSNNNNNKPLFGSFDEPSAPADNARLSHSSIAAASDEDTKATDLLTNVSKLKTLLWKRAKARTRKNIISEDSAEQLPVSQQQSQQQRNEAQPQQLQQHAERWRRFPMYHLQNLGKADLLQQLEEQRQDAFKSAGPDDGDLVYYDFK